MKKVILLVLDGFGIRNEDSANATKMASIPNLTKIFSENSVSELEASGSAVGLPDGLAGNCEAGHNALGCARPIKQPLTLINESIKDKSFFENDTLLDLIDHVNENNSTLHIIGLLSNSGIYSCIDHFYASLALAKIKNVKSVVFHFITDGKDSNESAKDTINFFIEKTQKLGLGTIGTICGRYYAMDQEGYYDRVKKAYDALIFNIGNSFSDYERCLDLHYKNNITDEFINPSIITKGSYIKDNDGVLFVNYRDEVIDELLLSLKDPDFQMFQTRKLKNVKFTTLFSTSNDIDSAYSCETVSSTFGKYLAELDYKQARISEASKYKHVTYYFDGCEELSDENLYKILIPSVKVPRFDMKPEMNISEVTNAIINAMEDDFDFILANFSNPDMVGHTGNIPAIVRSLEACDICIGKILEHAEENFYTLAIVSDHGNVELVKDENEKVNHAHTNNKVPFVIVDSEYKLSSIGKLEDVIPTILDLYELSKPKEMTGESLIIK